MVPVADMFNHKAAVVALSDGYQIEKSSDDESDTEHDSNELNEMDDQGCIKTCRDGELKMRSTKLGQNRISRGMCEHRLMNLVIHKRIM